MQGVLERARQLNACVAYGGVSPTALMEDDHVRVLLSLLPSAARTNGATKPLTVGALFHTHAVVGMYTPVNGFHALEEQQDPHLLLTRECFRIKSSSPQRKRAIT